ncbi:uncharacterized protein LAESUDRAFT_712585 [Laetiporus sulphureus 93-53]|uniref:Uncharacterized protein n=1 Tax=Laetiporus sulphureus 93-53 TaxID=1314785 RepID=A0A165FHV2_9APHY|nr:uncharacterized protein LAESUDRAFT_712585 [Laetiporus sulphureus 93-53]KZT08995.1 hypothetical protein LAESUDRAFT_712585 [Laetiporus sulphureus 93-53]
MSFNCSPYVDEYGYEDYAPRRNVWSIMGVLRKSPEPEVSSDDDSDCEEEGYDGADECSEMEVDEPGPSGHEEFADGGADSGESGHSAPVEPTKCTIEKGDVVWVKPTDRWVKGKVLKVSESKSRPGVQMYTVQFGLRRRANLKSAFALEDGKTVPDTPLVRRLLSSGDEPL